MTMADVLRIFLLITGAMLVYISYWLASESIAPRLVDRCRNQYERKPLRTLMLGLALAAPLVFLGVAVLGKSPHPAGKVLGVACLIIPGLMGLVGSAGLAKRLGQGLPSEIDVQQPWRRVLRGSIVLSITFLFPFLGWFFVMPATLVSGLGAMVMALREKTDATDHPIGQAVDPTSAIG
jgi:hypothetical protein